MFVPSDFVTIGLLIALEGLLSADNAMVLAVLVLGLPKAQRRKALQYGIVGAFAFRAIATLLAAYMIQLGWVKLVGAGYLLYLVYRHFGVGDTGGDRRTPPKAQPWMGLSPFWATVLKVELTDIVFAVDSILVAVAMSPKRSRNFASARVRISAWCFWMARLFAMRLIETKCCGIEIGLLCSRKCLTRRFTKY